MSMYKSVLRCALRSTSLWKSDSFIRTQTSLCYNSRSFAVSSHLWRTHTHEQTLKQVRFYSESDQDVQVKQTAALAESVEVSDKAERMSFHAHLQTCLCPADVLDSMKRFPASQHHVSSIFRRMWEITKRMRLEQRHGELQLMFEHSGFEEVCERAVTEAWRMRNDDLVHSLLAIIKLGVPQNTRVVQTLLRVVQERLNQFDIRSLSVLAASIQQMEDSRNVQALRGALRLLLTDRIPEINSVVVLQNLMRAVGRNSPIQLKIQLASKTLSLANEFTPPNTHYMFSSLATMNLNFKPLLDVCSRNIAENVHEFPFARLLMVLRSCHELQYRNYNLFNSISEYIANTCVMWSNKQMMLLLLTFEDLLFRPTHVLDAFAERIIQNPDSLTLKDLLGVLKVYSLLNHDLKENKTEFLAMVTKVLESYLPKMSPIELLKVVYYLALMEHFPPTLLEKLLQQETLDQLRNQDSLTNKIPMWLHTLGLCLRLDKPPLPPSLSSLPDLNFSFPAYEIPVNQEMLSAIRKIVGNDAVQESVLEQGIYLIDCVITLPGQKEETCSPHAEDSGSLERPQRIAVICTAPILFCFGTSHPRASLVLRLRHLEKLGYKPVLVPAYGLSSKTEEEQIKMLHSLIFPEQESSGTQKILSISPKTEGIS